MGGELKASRPGGLPRNLFARRSKPKMASLVFWRAFQDSCCVAMVEPAVSYLESTNPATLDELKARAEADSYQKGRAGKKTVTETI
jgi:hypothetical protein